MTTECQRRSAQNDQKSGKQKYTNDASNSRGGMVKETTGTTAYS